MNTVCGRVTFSNVLEYRWVADFIEYDDYPQHKDDYDLGLIEIIDSAYVENMASKGPLRNQSGHRFGEAVPESDVHHYRMGFDDYGVFEIIALKVKVEAVS